MNPAQDPGPFAATWSARTTTTAWTSGGALVDASRTATTLLTITGGGLTTARTLTVTGGDVPRAASWHVTPAAVAAASGTIAAAATAGPERTLWGVELPIALLIAAALVALTALRAQRRERSAPRPLPTPAPRTRSTPYAVK